MVMKLEMFLLLETVFATVAASFGQVTVPFRRVPVTSSVNIGVSQHACLKVCWGNREQIYAALRSC